MKSMPHGFRSGRCAVLGALGIILAMSACSTRSVASTNKNDASASSPRPSSVTSTGAQPSKSSANAMGTSTPGAQNSGSTAAPKASGRAPLTITTDLTPACVRPGGTMHIVVHTGSPYAAVAYLAVYSNGKSGAKQAGDDLGGNNGGMTAPNGDYTDSWVVSPKAPAGPARVEIRVGSPSGQQSASASFRVASVAGVC
jgi:hypothetical protein